ncbi:ABC transporter substrate-binding protein [Clostridium botulinum]|uniref:ABC transporter substrate-binding protein n=1 Tax=Clostridium botulinum TaxID=1491 RepID=A0A6B4Q9D2_CLOBO|nr:ABC transporter substrate-binding protein [Clostridium botulinum]MCS6110162.1 ABC transporter substrate-binding protein [Clostridium botulinum]NFE11323.1 ABC transporter substrate-binding protein [Clostridium botulinum]NFE58686.1 ABC transporter substrate-binding protein [Clostridium botulinum]NFE93948.1 ABC transporter substrate-binding protein [Clostridium botulinum]NFF88196.1 ABC transporter substrate-binding protein [Clostridium botulinum]
MKKLSIFLIPVISIFMIIGCGVNKAATIDEVKEINFVVPDGLPAISIAKMIKEKPEFQKGYNVNYNIEKVPDNVATSIMKSEADIAIVPSNIPAISYNKNGDYKIAGTVGWGAFYIVSTDNSQSIDDLKGKEIYNIGKGLTPDIITKAILKNNNIDPDKDVNLSYVGGVTEIAPVILSGKANYAVLPEPALSTVLSKKDNLNILLDLNEEWKKENDSKYGYPQATIIIKKDLIENNNKLVEKILREIENSTIWAYKDKEALGDYCEEIGVSANKNIIVSAMERANIKYVDIKDSVSEYNTYFKKLYEFDNITVGGNIPDEGIYMEK